MLNNTDVWLALATALTASLIFLRILCKEKARLDRYIHIRELHEDRKAYLRQMEADFESQRS